jgi:hypothetical protein
VPNRDRNKMTFPELKLTKKLFGFNGRVQISCNNVVWKKTCVFKLKQIKQKINFGFIINHLTVGSVIKKPFKLYKTKLLLKITEEHFCFEVN